VLLQLLATQAERQATVVVWEDLHWVDPSSLEFLTLLVEQIPTTKLLLVLTFRPDFTPSWPVRSHITQLPLNRLGQKQVEVMIEQVRAGTPLAAEVIAQIRTKADGVPLFVEEITKSVIEAQRGPVVGDGGQEGKGVGAQQAAPAFQVGIPTTLHDALMARLDRLGAAKEIAQLGATIGREFSYDLLHAMAPMRGAELQSALAKLREAEILYQRGSGEHACVFHTNPATDFTVTLPPVSPRSCH
jgi:predicted ATPase